MPGIVIDVRAEPSGSVDAGDTLVVLESMKMELSVVSPADGVVVDLYVQVGDHVAKGQPLVAVEAT